MRLLGIDFGLKRVGLAVSDRTGTLVSPLKTIERTTRQALFDELVEIIHDEAIEAVVVGLPLALSGEDTLTTRQARNFAQSLERRIDKPVHLMDERLTSAQAEEELNAAGLHGAKRKAALDSRAAAVIPTLMARLRRYLLIVSILLVVLAGLGAGGYRWYKAWQEERFLSTPPETPGREVLFRVEPGQIFTTIAANLKSEGLITDTRRFYRLAVRTGKGSAVRAGVFRLSTGWVPERVLTELTSSSGVMRRVSVREGLSWWQTAKVIAAAGLGGADGFAKAVADPGLLAKYGIEAGDAEGYLFPETYLLTPPKDHPARHMAEVMIREFFKNAHKVWPEGLPPFKEMHRAVILASLVEKETGDETERARIAGVFSNRLKKHMLIQCDPTIIYGLGPDFDGNLKKSDLTDKGNPYNTYVHPGLPPGPICSPGLDSLLAAVPPEKHDFLYFVAKGDGSHQFSRTLEEHNRAVRKYQLRRNRATYRSTRQ